MAVIQEKRNFVLSQVDNDCDGTVDWNEYLSYMLLEYQEKDNMLTHHLVTPFAFPMAEKPSNHVESISRICLLQVGRTRLDRFFFVISYGGQITKIQLKN